MLREWKSAETAVLLFFLLFYPSAQHRLLITKLGDSMDQMSEEDRKRILESPPVGTFALMSAVIGAMVVAWLFLYYGVFLPRG